MFWSVKEDKLQILDTTIDYITFGTGNKNLVMIQGLNTRGIRGAGIGLAFMYRIFAQEYKVYLFDRRPDIWEGITVRDFAKDIAAAMDKLNIKSADIIGVSQGGMIAQYLAIDRPDLVHKIVLVVTISKNNDTVKGVISNWIEMTQNGNMKALVTDMAMKMYSDEYMKRYKLFLPLLTIIQKPKDVNRFILLAKSCLTCEAYEELDKITCPVLVIGGKRDKVVSGEASVEIADKLKCEMYLYEKLGHAVYEEAKDFNQKVFDFLKK
ncbi:MAG: alpha/beta hydrolase [Lachnospiraceae bacterium]|nr:alpha/beta hydrolase [Lachnospiraceae bacterium]